MENKNKLVRSYNLKVEKDKLYTNYDGSNPSDKQYEKIVNSLGQGKSILSLGCGEGREVKALVKCGHKVTAIDSAERMVESSKKIEPNAEYFVSDVVDFAENNTHRKFDKIIGLFSLYNYIDTPTRRKNLAKNLPKLLTEDGELILSIHILFEGWKEVLKFLLAPFFAIYYRELKDYRFGDEYSKRGGVWTKTHTYSKRELNKLFRNYDINYEKLWKQTKVTIKKRLRKLIS